MTKKSNDRALLCETQLRQTNVMQSIRKNRSEKITKLFFESLDGAKSAELSIQSERREQYRQAKTLRRLSNKIFGEIL